MITLRVERRPPILVEIEAQGETIRCELEDFGPAAASQLGLAIGTLLVRHDLETAEPLAWVKSATPGVSSLTIDLIGLLEGMGFSASVLVEHEEF